MLLATSFQLQLEMLDDLALVKKFFWKVGRWNVGWVLPWCFYANTPPKCNSEFPLTNDGRMEDDLPFERWQILSGYVKLPGSKAICFRKGRFFVNHSSTNPREVVKMSLLTAQGLDLGNLQYIIISLSDWKLGGSYAPFLKHQLCIAPRSSRYMLMFLCRRKLWSIWNIYI